MSSFVARRTTCSCAAGGGCRVVTSSGSGRATVAMAVPSCVRTTSVSPAAGRGPNASSGSRKCWTRPTGWNFTLTGIELAGTGRTV